MTTQFKIGDRVKITAGIGFSSYYVGREGTIVSYDEGDAGLPFRVDFDGGDYDWGRPAGMEHLVPVPALPTTVKEKLAQIKQLVAEVEAVLYK